MPGSMGSGATCPECCAPTSGGGRTVVWCPSCDWNVDPHPPPSPATRRARWAARASERLVEGLYEEVVREGVGLRRTGRAGLLAGLLAVAVHLLTLATVGLGVLVLAVIRPWWVAVPLAVVPLGVGFLLLPRPAPLRDGTWLLTQEQAPWLYELVARVAAVVGAPVPQLVGVDADFNAWVSRVGWRQRRVLVLGLPLWHCLEPQARVALIGHELGHEVNADPRRGLLVGSALEALDEWYRLTDQGGGARSEAAPSDRLELMVWRTEEGGLVALGSIITRALLEVVGLVPRWAYLALRAATMRSSQRAEYWADIVGARVAGPGGSAALESCSLLRDSFDLGVRREAMSGQGDVVVAGRAQVLQLPAAEVRRQLRRIAVRPRQAFASHPPADLRHSLASSLPPAAPLVVLDEAWLARIDDELEPWTRAASTRLREQARSRP